MASVDDTHGRATVSQPVVRNQPSAIVGRAGALVRALGVAGAGVSVLASSAPVVAVSVCVALAGHLIKTGQDARLAHMTREQLGGSDWLAPPEVLADQVAHWEHLVRPQQVVVVQAVEHYLGLTDRYHDRADAFIGEVLDCVLAQTNLVKQVGSAAFARFASRYGARHVGLEARISDALLPLDFRLTRGGRRVNVATLARS